MSLVGKIRVLVAALAVAACATVPGAPWVATSADGWTPVAAQTRTVGLGLLPGARLTAGVRFAGGIDIVSPGTPLHGLSDLKIVDGDLISVSDAGDLARARLRLDGRGRLTGLDQARIRRLTLTDGSPITDKGDGDAEGLVITPTGDLLISFERDHRIWNYGSLARLDRAPVPVWDCTPAGCRTVVAPPEPLLADSDYRITGLDRDPAGDGWFVIERSFRPPGDVRARVRRMAPDGNLGPVLITLQQPGTVDNFEGIAAVTTPGGVRLYLLSDDNFSDRQRTLLLAFDLATPRP